MLIDRAIHSKGGIPWKFNGFAGHFQDYAPALDHITWMRTAIDYMLIQNDFVSGKIYLFASWPCDWNVKYKFHAANNTVIIMDYAAVDENKGKLNNFVVEPKERMNDVVFVNCIVN